MSTRYMFFDLDNTLCESKQPVGPTMLSELERLNERHRVCIISGAELSRMLIQVPMKYVVFMAQNGNEIYDNEKILWKNPFNNKKAVMDHICAMANELQIMIDPDMIEDRGSQISFSFIGHHAPPEIKKAFDPERKIRMALLDKLPFTGAVIGGTTCIDYVPATKGDNIKRYMALKKLKPHEVIYFGDAFMKHGNDETVMGVLPTFQVKGWQDVYDFTNKILYQA